MIDKTVFFLKQGEDEDASVIKYSFLPNGGERERIETVKEKEEILLDYFQLKRLSMATIWNEWITFKKLQWEAAQKGGCVSTRERKPEEKEEKEEENEADEEGEEEEHEGQKAETVYAESRLLTHFKAVAPRFQGLRILRQDPVECLVPSPTLNLLLLPFLPVSPPFFQSSLSSGRFMICYTN